MKRIAKFSLYLLIGAAVIAIVLFSGFRAIEHFKGNDYISYLENNIESAALSEPLTFEIMEDDIRNSKLIIVGEVHGLKVNTKLDPQFFSYLHREHNIRDYMIEMDVAQAYYMNQYNQTGDEKLLKRILRNWVVRIGRENEDYKQKWMDLRKIYLEQGTFTYYGNNNLNDVDLLVDYIQDELKFELYIDPEDSDSVKLANIKKQILAEQITDTSEWTIAHVLKNIDYALDGKYREQVMTDNLIDIYDHFNLYDKQVYGYYGLGHTMLAPLADGYESMPVLFKKAKPEMEGNILAANFIYLDSYMTIHSTSLPRILRDEGELTQLSVSYDNICMNYLHGIDELRRTTDPHSFNIVKLNGEDSPYKLSRRLSTMSQLLPMGSLMQSREEDVTTDITQYMFLARNSEGAK